MELGTIQWQHRLPDKGHFASQTSPVAQSIKSPVSELALGQNTSTDLLPLLEKVGTKKNQYAMLCINRSATVTLRGQNRRVTIYIANVLQKDFFRK